MKKKLIFRVIRETCETCLFCIYDGRYTIRTNSGYDCEHPDSKVGRIVDDDAPGGWPEIPDICPLDDYEGE